jgi:hypothetical protein
MIIEFIFNLILALLKIVFGILPNVPTLNSSLLTSVNNVFDTIFSHLELLGLFVRISTIQILVPLLIIALNFEHIYHFAMWVLKKIPLSID